MLSPVKYTLRHEHLRASFLRVIKETENIAAPLQNALGPAGNARARNARQDRRSSATRRSFQTPREPLRAPLAEA